MAKVDNLIILFILNPSLNFLFYFVAYLAINPFFQSVRLFFQLFLNQLYLSNYNSYGLFPISSLIRSYLSNPLSIQMLNFITNILYLLYFHVFLYILLLFKI